MTKEQIAARNRAIRLAWDCPYRRSIMSAIKLKRLDYQKRDEAIWAAYHTRKGTLKALAKKYGVTRARIHQIYARRCMAKGLNWRRNAKRVLPTDRQIPPNNNLPQS